MSICKKIKTQTTALLVFTLMLSVGASYADQYTVPTKVETVSLSSSVTAGLSAALSTEDMVPSVVTAGVSDHLMDGTIVGYMKTASPTLGIGYAEDGTFCGYTNVGIALVDGNLNVREEPSMNGHIVGKMTNYAACEVLGIEGDWVHISSGKVEGYVNSDYIVTGEEAVHIAQEQVKLVAEVQTDGLRVRKEPNTDSGILDTVGTGEDLPIIEEMGEWIKVEVDDAEGYVFAEYVNVTLKLKTAMTLTELRFGDGVSDGRVALCQFALQYVGNPYVWGGTSLTKGADCSGFVLSVFANYGYSLPHSSKAQANCGTRVKTSELKPGDLIFYGSGKSISHVAIYIGGGQIVHASNKRDGIKISNAFYRSPICCTRIIND